MKKTGRQLYTDLYQAVAKFHQSQSVGRVNPGSVSGVIRRSKIAVYYITQQDCSFYAIDWTKEDDHGRLVIAIYLYPNQAMEFGMDRFYARTHKKHMTNNGHDFGIEMRHIHASCLRVNGEICRFCEELYDLLTELLRPPSFIAQHQIPTLQAPAPHLT